MEMAGGAAAMPNYPKTTANNEICLLCTKAVDGDKKLTGISQNPTLLRLLSKGCGVTIPNDPYLPDTVCMNCIFTVNFYLEYQSRIHRNFLKLRINNCIRIGDRQRAQSFQRQFRPRVCVWYDTDRRIHTSSSRVDSNLIQYHERLIHKFDIDGSGAGGDDVVVGGDDDVKFRGAPPPASSINHPPRRAPSMEEVNRITISDVRSQVGDDEFRTTTDEEEYDAAAADTSYLLTPMYNDLLENASATESGGEIHIQNKMVDAMRQRKQFYCQHCPKVYTASRSLKRHQRKHDKELQSPPQAEQARAAAERLRERAQCLCPHPGCEDKVFGTMAQLRRHCREHEPIHKCPECGQSFRLLHDYSWHLIQCTARRDCQREKESLATGEKIPFAARRLRSQCSSNDGERSDNYSSNSSVCTDTDNSLFSQKQNFVKIWRSNNPAAGNARSARSSSPFSDSSSVTMMDRYDASESEFSDGSKKRFSTNKQNEDLKAIRKKRKSNKRKALKLGLDHYQCSFENCSFGSQSLSDTMLHEEQYHKVLLLHFCNECNEWFSTKENLIRHRKRHRAFVHTCLQCHQYFDNKYDLEHHLMVHHEKSFPCSYCSMSFLKESTLDQHCIARHANEKIVRARILCRIQSHAHKLVRTSTTAVSTRPFEGYKSKVLIQSRAGGSGRRQQQRPQYRQPRRQIRVAPINRLHRKKLGNAAGIRKHGFDFEYYDYDDADGVNSYTTTTMSTTANRRRHSSSIHSNEDERTKRLKVVDENDGASMSDDPPNIACNAPASSYSDYSGSPVQFNSTSYDETLMNGGSYGDPTEEVVDDIETEPAVSLPSADQQQQQQQAPLQTTAAAAATEASTVLTEPLLVFPKSEPGSTGNSTATINTRTINAKSSSPVLYSDHEWLNIFSIDCLQSSASDREEETKNVVQNANIVENASSSTITLNEFVGGGGASSSSVSMPPTAGDIDCVIIRVTTARQRHRANRLKIVNLPITIVNRCIPSYDLLHDMQPLDVLRMKDALERYEYQPDKPFRVRID